MTLLLKPKGRGNWTPILMRITGQRAGPLLVRTGELITLGGVTFRIAEVRA